MDTYDFEPGSPTAWGPVIGRGVFTDIPYAREMLTYLERPHSERRIGRLPDEFLKGTREHAAFFEARFKAVNRVLIERQARQILELAAGYSPRALDPAFSGVRYLEADLPKMIEQKREIVTALLGSIPAHLEFCPASVLNREELAQGLVHFREEPIFVTSEGLLRYLTFDEKTRLAENVHAILSVYGGAWITPDVHLKQWSPGQRRKDRPDWGFAEQLGRDVNLNYFDDLDHARSFFEGRGFEVEERPLLEGIRQQVISLPLAPEELLAELESRRIFILTPRS